MSASETVVLDAGWDGYAQMRRIGCTPVGVHLLSSLSTALCTAGKLLERRRANRIRGGARRASARTGMSEAVSEVCWDDNNNRERRSRGFMRNAEVQNKMSKGSIEVMDLDEFKLFQYLLYLCSYFRIIVILKILLPPQFV